ncbi:hypothetical protein C8R47DRAFT_1228448 [Mycena vitilis]|nr:hypothetical protein C8R47DRAFT_1228448 [Mycena vitilis]
MEPPPLLQNGVVFGIPPANAPAPNYPACSAKFFPDLSFAGLQKYETAEATPPGIAAYAFYCFLPTEKDGRLYTSRIEAEKAAKALHIPTSKISQHRRLLPACNAIYTWCKDAHDHAIPERCSDRRKKPLEINLTTYNPDLQKRRIRRYQNDYGVAPSPPHVLRQSAMKGVVVSAALVPAEKRLASVADADAGFQPGSPTSIKRRRFHPAPSVKKPMPTSDRVLPFTEHGPSCYVLLTRNNAPAPATPTKSAAAPATSRNNSSVNSPPSSASPGWFVLANGEVFEDGTEAEERMKRKKVKILKIVSDLEAGRVWLNSIGK